LSNIKISPDGTQQSGDVKSESNDNKNDGTTDGTSNGGENDANDDESQGCYNKGKSFFDSISCEAVERSKGKVQRIDWKAERKLNHETFGVSMHNYRRQGFRGGRGYGGGRIGIRNQSGGYGSNRTGIGGGGDTRRYVPRNKN